MANSQKYRTIVPDLTFWKQMIPCQAACPIQTDAGKYVQLIAEGDYRGSYLTARSPNPFASVCGRVCAAPCEDRCRRGALDEPVSIRALKRYAAERFGVESLAPDTQDELLVRKRQEAGGGRRVAVVGAGPAGLACAHDLALLGYRVTVFEATDTAGGMLFHGIPEFRLPRPVIDKEIRKIVDLGVEMKLNRPLGRDFGLAELRELGYEAVFLGVGTQRGRELAVEGSELDGVIKAIDFLLNVNHGYRVSLGQKVLVVGGGFVAFDAARMAIRAAVEGEPGSLSAALDAARAAVRAGVAEVRMVSLESFAEMPVLRTAQGREEFEEARREGVAFHPQRGIRRLAGEDGRVRSVDLIGVRRTYDESGRFDPVYDPAVSETLDADTVILAIGQRADLAFLRPDDGVEVTPGGTIRVDPESLATTAPGVYAGGDVAFGPRNLIEAVANGKQAARSIDQHLRRGETTAATRVVFRQIPTRAYRMAPGYEKEVRAAPPSIPLDRRTGISEVESGYDEAAARRQAERCLYCHIQTVYDPEKCVLCNRCVDICPEYCLKLVPVEQVELDWPLEAGEAQSAMIKDDEKCIRCGLCAIRCPTDAMTMEVLFYEDRE
jgi:NADPH-dependent glutamate synthase beta subunit-like oxidoreductase